MATLRFNWENLRNWVRGRNQPPPMPIVKRSDLIKVGGLYRIRDNYEPVWKMEAGEDGRSYIVRVGEEGTEERCLIAEEDSTEDYAKAAYRTLVGNKVHILWECESCSAPNITKEGNPYECDNCHKKYSDVLSHPRDQSKVYDRETAAAQFGDWVVERMKREGVSKIHISLIKAWEEEN